MIGNVYDVAISYASEDRPYAEALVRSLKALQLDVFYDEDNRSDLLGEDLYQFLAELYEKRTRSVVPILSKSYAEKLWTNHELKAAQAQALKSKHAFIFPIRLDDTPITGVLDTVGHIEWKGGVAGAEGIAKVIHQKLQTAGRGDKAPPQDSPREGRKKAKPSFVSMQNRLEDIYREANKDLDVWYIYGYLSRTVDYLCKDLYKNSAKKEDFVRPFSWLFTLASKIGCDVHDSFIAKYPDCCPHCLGVSCVCFKTGKRPLEDLEAYEVRDAIFSQYRNILTTGREYTLKAAAQKILSIYPHNEVIWHFAGPGHQIAKIHEEVAEIHEALVFFLSGKKSLKAVSEEIADVFSWLLTAWQLQFPNASLDNEFIEYYRNGCPVCTREVCTCKRYSGRSEGLIDHNTVMAINVNLHQLSDAAPSAREDIGELIHSVEAASDQNQAVTRLALVQLLYRLNKLKKTIPRDGQGDGSKALNMIDMLIDLILKATHSHKLL